MLRSVHALTGGTMNGYDDREEGPQAAAPLPRRRPGGTLVSFEPHIPAQRESSATESLPTGSAAASSRPIREIGEPTDPWATPVTVEPDRPPAWGARPLAWMLAGALLTAAVVGAVVVLPWMPWSHSPSTPTPDSGAGPGVGVIGAGASEPAAGSTLAGDGATTTSAAGGTAASAAGGATSPAGSSAATGVPGGASGSASVPATSVDPATSSPASVLLHAELTVLGTVSFTITIRNPGSAPATWTNVSVILAGTQVGQITVTAASVSVNPVRIGDKLCITSPPAARTVAGGGYVEIRVVAAGATGVPSVERVDDPACPSGGA
jgi:uncharacterized repeat protein (TIGR01451 family)